MHGFRDDAIQLSGPGDPARYDGHVPGDRRVVFLLHVHLQATRHSDHTLETHTHRHPTEHYNVHMSYNTNYAHYKYSL